MIQKFLYRITFNKMILYKQDTVFDVLTTTMFLSYGFDITHSKQLTGLIIVAASSSYWIMLMQI